MERNEAKSRLVYDVETLRDTYDNRPTYYNNNLDSVVAWCTAKAYQHLDLTDLDHFVIHHVIELWYIEDEEAEQMTDEPYAVCTTRGKQLDRSETYLYNGTPYCKEHYMTTTGKSCANCTSCRREPNNQQWWCGHTGKVIENISGTWCPNREED